MRIYNNNYIDDVTLTPSAVKGGYSADNLRIPQLARKFSFPSNTGNIVMEFTIATQIKALLVDIGNMTSSVTVTLEGNSTNEWTSPAYSEELLYTETALYLDLDQTYQYYRLVFNDPGVDIINFGYIYIGDAYLQMPHIDPEVTLYYNTTSVATNSIGGQVYGDEGYEYLSTMFNFPKILEESSEFNGITVANRKEILAMWKRVKNIQPVWVMLWSNSLDEYPPVFCVINQSTMSFKKNMYKEYSLSLALMEVL